MKITLLPDKRGPGNVPSARTALDNGQELEDNPDRSTHEREKPSGEMAALAMVRSRLRAATWVAARMSGMK